MSVDWKAAKQKYEDLKEHMQWFQYEASLSDERSHLEGWHGNRLTILYSLRGHLISLHEEAHEREGEKL